MKHGDKNGKEGNHKSKRGHRLLELFGLHVPEGRDDRLHVRPRFFKFLGFLGVLILILLVGMFEFSTSPYFCSSCHIMKPYYQAWKTSSHNHVPCVECHYPPELREKLWLKFQAFSQVAKYVTKTYSSKPYAEISDTSCLRKGCHEKRLLERKVVFKKGIKFYHKPHLTLGRRGKKLRCTSCHSQVVVGNHMEVTESTCFLCHFKGKVIGRNEEPLGGCPSCHSAPTGDIEFEGITFNHKDFVGDRGIKCLNCHLDAVQGSGEAPKDRCFQCHNNEKTLSMYDDTNLIHKMHVTEHKVDCTQCHLKIEHKVRTAVEPLQYNCSICHENKHNATKEMYAGTGGKGVPRMPSVMFISQVDCIGCHKIPLATTRETEFTGQTYRASEAACVSCHGEEYEGILGEWKESVRNGTEETGPILREASEIAKKTTVRKKDFQKGVILLNRARYNFNFVKLGNGFHNVDYALAILEKTKSDAKQALELFKKTRGEQ